MDTILAIKEVDLNALKSEMSGIRSELERIKGSNQLKTLTKNDICDAMNWDPSTFERMRRNPILPLPAYKMGGIRVDYNAFIDWKTKYIQYQKEGKI